MSQTQNIIGYVARNRKTDQYGAYSYADEHPPKDD